MQALILSIIVGRTNSISYELCSPTTKNYDYGANKEADSMKKYLNNGGSSNVEAYELGATYIDVKFFKTPKVYRYSYHSAGREKVETMKELACKGSGLNSYIMRNARFDYEK